MSHGVGSREPQIQQRAKRMRREVIFEKCVCGMKLVVPFIVEGLVVYLTACLFVCSLTVPMNVGTIQSTAPCQAVIVNWQDDGVSRLEVGF